MTDTTLLLYKKPMNSKELQKLLKRQGCEFIASRGKGGHITVVNPKNGKRTTLPTHGSRKELGTGLVKAIKKQLEIE